MKQYFLFLITIFLLVSCNQNNETNELTLIVASKRIDCIGEGTLKCFLIKRNENLQNWEYLYPPIHGFTYETGYEYKIVIEEEEIENPPADASSIKYTLLEVISKAKKDSKNLPT